MTSRWLLPFLLLIAGCGGGGSSGGTLPGGIFVSIQPAADTLFPGCSAIFKATVTGSANQGVTWNAVGGSITEHGVYTAPGSTGAFVVIATSQADPTKSAQVTINVIPSVGINVSVAPNSATVAPNQTRQFTAQVLAAPGGVTWSAARGTISSSGFYRAPLTEGTDTIVARSTFNPAASAKADIVVDDQNVQVTINPLTPSLCIRENIQMTAQVTNATNTDVTWIASGGSIDANGLYTAPSAPGNYDIRATSVEDPTKFATTQVTVKPITITVTPQSIIVAADDVVKFSAVVTGPANTDVTWSASAGTIQPSGYYFAPSSTGICVITATSVSDPFVSATAFVEVAVPIAILTETFDVPPPRPPWNWGHWWEGNGRHVLGGEGVWFELDNLPSHRGLRVTYDCYFSGEWSNDTSSLEVIGGYKHTTLGFSNVPGVNQSYPNGGMNPPQTGALEVNVMNRPPGSSDARYKLHAPLVHTGPSGAIRWPTDGPTTTFWLDNVTVEYFP